MSKKKKLERMTIMSEGKEIPFREFIREAGGTGTLYEKDIRDLFKNWPIADFAYIDDYVVPIAAQVINDAAELDRESYEKIMKVITEAYSKMRPVPPLTRIK